MAKDDDKQADADFNEGFASEAVKQPPKVEAKEGVKEAKGEPVKEGVAAVSDPPPKGEVPDPAKNPRSPPQNPATQGKKPDPKPPGVKPLSDQELESLRAAALKALDQDKQLSKAFGTIGQLQKQLNEMREKTEPKPVPVKLDPVTERLRAQAMEDLEDEYPDWRDIVGASDKPDPDHPFRKWLATQPEEYQKKINASNSAHVVSRAIAKFKAATEKVEEPKPQSVTQQVKDKVKAKIAAAEVQAARRDRIANAVPPKTTSGVTPVRSRTPDDDFREGFASG